MATDQDPELGRLRTNVDKAIREFVTYRVRLFEDQDNDPYVLGWAVMTEYTDPDLLQQDLMGTMSVVPDDQPAAFTGGLFGVGARSFGQ